MASRENFLALKQIKNKCTNITKTAKKQYFAKSAENQRWNVITLKEKVRFINDELEVAETSNSHYINIVKTTWGQPPQALGNPKDGANDIASIDAIISNYKNHPSINQIRKNALILRYIVFLKQKRRNKYTNQASESQKGNRTRWNTT